MTTTDTARALADAAALDVPDVLAATSITGLIQALVRITHAIDHTPTEAAADGLRVQRHLVSEEIEARCSR